MVLHVFRLAWDEIIRVTSPVSQKSRMSQVTFPEAETLHPFVDLMADRDRPARVEAPLLLEISLKSLHCTGV